MREKADLPENTIHQIRSLLHGLGIFVVERAWFEQDTLCSVTLAMDEVPSIATSGKGRNPKYALASAYGEFAERLQNLVSLQASFRCGNLPLKKPQYPDVMPGTWAQIKHDHGPLLKAALGVHDDAELEALLRTASPAEAFDLYPCYHVNRGRVVNLPLGLCSLSVGSNGMAAGNTPEEALTQAVSEVLENYVLKRTYTDQLSFPTVPAGFLDGVPSGKYPRWLAERGFQVTVKDCSCEGKFPVVGVVAKRDGKAAFAIAAAVDFSIALERCFTKLFEGARLHSLDAKMLPVAALDAASPERSFSSPSKRMWYRYCKSLGGCGGTVPPSLLVENVRFDPSHLSHCDDLTSARSLRRLVRSIEGDGWDLYIRDVSFMGFPTFFVYVPGMSEVLLHDREGLRLRLTELSRAKKTFYGLEDAGAGELRHLIGTIEAMLDDPFLARELIMPTLHNLQLSEQSPLTAVEPEDVLVALHLALGQVGRALAVLDGYVERAVGKARYEERDVCTLPHACLSSLLQSLSEGVSRETARQRAANRFDGKLVDVLLDTILSGKPRVFLGIPICIDCDGCAIRSECRFDRVARVAAKVERAMADYEFDQMKICQYFV